MNKQNLKQLAAALSKQDRRALARAITLIESQNPDHQKDADELLSLLPNDPPGSLRIGLTGTPGVGKSTFIEALGMHLCAKGHRVAVLAVDPSSRRSGGAILGDKTRMPELSRRKDAFIRPSPSQNTLGGVAAQTRSVIALVEAAGFDITLVETVGVGQSETMVADLTDLFVLLLAPAGGDELQGVKRGIMELADLVLVNKADGDLAAQAQRTAADYAGALQLIRRPAYTPDEYPKAMTLSALEGNGLVDAWEAMKQLDIWRAETGFKDQRRIEQRVAAFEGALERTLLKMIKSEPGITQFIQAQKQSVLSGEAAPAAAARLVADQVTTTKLS